MADGRLAQAREALAQLKEQHTPLGRARKALQEARARVEYKDSPTHRQALAAAWAHMDYLLDTLPIQTPPGPVAHRPGPGVSYALNTTGQAEQVVPLEELLEDECTTTSLGTDSEDV